MFYEVTFGKWRFSKGSLKGTGAKYRFVEAPNKKQALKIFKMCYPDEDIHSIERSSKERVRQHVSDLLLTAEVCKKRGRFI